MAKRKPLTFGSLFAGIGGFDLGLERAGMVCKWQVEINEFCRRVLTKHWPDVPKWDDVCTFPPKPRKEWQVDVISGGFPCQDISPAGKKVGITGERSGLWDEFSRIVRTLRPKYVLVENSADLAVRGLGKVLGDLSQFGFDAEWSTVPSCAVGAPHMRKRLFVVAYPDDGEFGERWRTEFKASCKKTRNQHQWCRKPGVARTANGLPSRMDRVKSIGNAVVPQIVELIGRAIVEAHQATQEED